MAGGAPTGNRNGAKQNRLLGDTLKRELIQNPNDALAVARKTIDAAKAGEAWAQQLIYDRVDGKLPTPVGGSDELPPLSFSEVLFRAVDAKPSDRSSTEG